MNSAQKFLLIVAALSGVVFYLVAGVFSEPPLWARLALREPVTVMTVVVETRQSQPPALPVIEIRDAQGKTSLLQGYGWMDAEAATEVAAAAPVGALLDAPRFDGKLWRGISGLGDWLLLIVSAFAAFVLVFSLWMILKLRTR